MSASVAPVVEAIWDALGLPQPVERIESRFRFEANGAEVEIVAAPNGREAILRVLLGQLGPRPDQARDQAISLLRQGLGLMAVNSAALTTGGAVPLDRFAALDRGAEPDGAGAPIDIYAEAVVALALRDRAEAERALTDLLQWHSLAANMLLQKDAISEVAPEITPGTADLDDNMMIFRP